MLHFADPRFRVHVRWLQGRLPNLEGRPILLEFRSALRDRRGPVHAGAFLRERRILFDAELRQHPRELARVLAHELFHFVWVRLGNPRRRSYEVLIMEELGARARGELGWSAEWRRRALQPRDAAARTRRWREYLAESFCDTAAWMYSGLRTHEEFTLARRFRARRRRWFERWAAIGRNPI